MVDGNESRVPNGDVLIAFAEAVVRRHADEIERSRKALLERMGPGALVDSAGVVANFERMVRIADSTGIPLDSPVAAMTADIREQIGIEGFRSARNTPRSGPLGRVLGRVGRSLGLMGIRAAVALGRRRDDKKTGG
jgi:hypothetical protein